LICINTNNILVKSLQILVGSFSNKGANHKLRATGTQLQDVAKTQVLLMIDTER
jgi:hypothetical protein